MSAHLTLVSQVGVAPVISFTCVCVCVCAFARVQGVSGGAGGGGGHSTGRCGQTSDEEEEEKEATSKLAYISFIRILLSHTRKKVFSGASPSAPCETKSSALAFNSKLTICSTSSAIVIENESRKAGSMFGVDLLPSCSLATRF